MLGAQNLIFLGLNFVTISLDNSKKKNQFLGSLFLFFLLFFLPFFVFSLAFYFQFFHFLFYFSERKIFLRFLLVSLTNMFYCWQRHQSVVGAPWRCGVLTTQGGIAGIGLNRLLGREHASTPQSGVEAPRLLKRSLTRLYYCCC